METEQKGKKSEKVDGKFYLVETDHEVKKSVNVEDRKNGKEKENADTNSNTKELETGNDYNEISAETENEDKEQEKQNYYKLSQPISGKWQKRKINLINYINNRKLKK